MITATGFVFVLAFMFVFGTNGAQAAFNACACSCIDSEASTSLLRSVVPGQTCLQAYGSGSACTAPSVFVNAYEHNYPTLGDRCVIECSDFSTRTEWISLSPNKTDCRDDCTEACQGAANLDPTQNQNQNVYSVPCIRDDHCSLGAFSVYEDVRCEYEQLTAGDDGYGEWPDNVRPRCIVPPTLMNADKECREYGGEARGGLCIRIPSGTSPAGYFITRPYVNSTGAYSADTFNETDLDSLNSRLDDWSGNPGLCMLFGLAEGVEFDIEEEIPIGINIGEGTVDVGPIGTVSGSSRYICAKRKSNTCGSEPPTSALMSQNIRSATQFRCLVPELNGISENYCFSESESQSLCVNDPGTMCCAQIAAGCQDNADCYPPKQCMNIDAATGFGECKFNPVCDPEHDDRRCRPADDPEKANSSICSPPLHTMSPFGTRCQNPSQACCNNGTPEAIGTCASDMAVPGKTWSNYTCVDPGDIPSSQFMTNLQGARELISWEYPNAHCISNSVPAGGRVGAPLERCRNNKVCCDLTEMVQSDRNTYLVGSPIGQNGRYTYVAGAPCPGYIHAGIETLASRGFESYQCTDPGQARYDDFAQERGYIDASGYLGVLSRSSYCEVTPLSPGHYLNNEECAPGYLCCVGDIDLEGLCRWDDDCTEPGMRCDLEVGLCVPGEALEAAQELGGDSCYALAAQAGDTSGQNLIGMTLDDGSEATAQSFTCQIVDESSNVSATQCLQKGCDNISGDVPEGFSRRCCLPGVGVVPTAAAGEDISARAEDIQRGRFTIGLPACIGTGQCGLDDIVATGANFANLLIGLSGSVFLGIFVYAGFLYLTAGTSDRVGKAKKMIIQSSFAMVLILGAFVFVRFIQQSLISSATGNEQAECGNTEDTKGSACTLLPVDANDREALTKAMGEKGCVPGLCPGAANYVCCPQAEE